MRKKILLAAIIIALLAAICVIWFINNSNTEDPQIEISWDMSGAFVHADGTEEAITVSIDGKIIEEKTGGRSLHGNVDLPEGFRYILGDTDGALAYIENQEHDHFPNLMMFQSYIYNAPRNASTPILLALDFEKEYAIAMIDDAPYCYLVAARESGVEPQQLLAHFKDYIDAQTTSSWGNKPK